MFQTLQTAIGGVTEDRRLQLLLIAFSFGAFFEGASGFGTPVAVTGAILIGLGFSPLAASGLSLIANTAPVAYGALGTPIAGLASVTGLDPFLLGAMVGRQLPFFSLIVPFWLIWAFAGYRGMKEVWPAILVTGVSFAIPQFLISNFINPWIVDIGASLISMACLIGFLKIWKPGVIWTSPALRTRDDSAATMPKKPVESDTGADNSRSVVFAAALDHRLRDLVAVGHQRCQRDPECLCDLEFSSSWLAQHDQQSCPGRAGTHKGSRGILVHLAVLHRFRHVDCRDHLRVADGILHRCG